MEVIRKSQFGYKKAQERSEHWKGHLHKMAMGHATRKDKIDSPERQTWFQENKDGLTEAKDTKNNKIVFIQNEKEKKLKCHLLDKWKKNTLLLSPPLLLHLLLFLLLAFS